MNLATSTDVAIRWRPLSSDEQLLAEALLGDASAILRARFPGIDASIAGGSLDAGNVTTVAAGMVKRAMILGNNEGVKADTETAGPFSFSRSYASASAALALTDSDLLLILGYRPAGVSVTYGS